MIVFRIVRALLFLPYRLLFWIKATGREHIPKTGAAILSSTHVHLFDPITHAFAQRRLFRSMAKVEIFKNRFFGAVVRSLGGFPIRRGHSDKAAMGEAIKVLTDQQDMLLVFPEGTRSRKTFLPLEFKPGLILLAHQTGAPIVPAVIYAKHGYRPFSRIKVTYGKSITTAELGVGSGSSVELRAAAAQLRRISEEMLARERNYG